MIPDCFEPLSFDDNVFVARINLCYAAVVLFVFAWLGEAWPLRSVLLAASAGVLLLARQLDAIAARFRPPAEPDRRGDPAPRYPIPF